MINWQNRLHFASKVAGWHLLLSVIVATLVAALVFFVWYPYPLREVTGSFGLFWLVVGVDVVCGPLITLLLSSPKKSRREMVVDISLVILIQLSAFAYGMYHVYESRPVVVVFEVDRLRVLTAMDIKQDELPEAAEDYRKLPYFGHFTLATRGSKDGDDTLDSIEMSLKGFDIGQRPSWWIPYSKGKEKIRTAAKPIADLKNLTPNEQKSLDAALKKAKKATFYLPLTSNRTSDMIALLDDEMNLVGAAKVRGFPGVGMG